MVSSDMTQMTVGSPDVGVIRMGCPIDSRRRWADSAAVEAVVRSRSTRWSLPLDSTQWVTAIDRTDVTRRTRRGPASGRTLTATVPDVEEGRPIDSMRHRMLVWVGVSVSMPYMGHKGDKTATLKPPRAVS